MVGKPNRGRKNGTRNLVHGTRSGVASRFSSKKADLRFRLSQSETGRQAVASSEVASSDISQEGIAARVPQSEKNTKHTDLSEIKVKTLDEIKREKQQRLLAEEAVKVKQLNGEEIPVQKDCLQPVASCGESTPSCSAITSTNAQRQKGNLYLKIPLMAPDSTAVLGARNLSKAQEDLSLHRSTTKEEQAEFSDEDLEPLDENDDECSNEDDARNEHSLLHLRTSGTDEDMGLPTTSTPFTRNHDRPLEDMDSPECEYSYDDDEDDSGTSSSEIFSDVLLCSSHNEDERDEVLSLHPMSTEFDDEEENLWHSKGSSFEKRQKPHISSWVKAKETSSSESQGRSTKYSSELKETESSFDSSVKERSWKEEKNSRHDKMSSSTSREKNSAGGTSQQRLSRPKPKRNISQRKDQKDSRQHGFERKNRNNGPPLLPTPLTNPFSSDSTSLAEAVQQLEEIKRCQNVLVQQNPLLPLAVQFMSSQGAFGPNLIQPKQNSEMFEFARPRPPGDHRHRDFVRRDRPWQKERMGLRGMMLDPKTRPKIGHPDILPLMSLGSKYLGQGQMNNIRKQGNMGVVESRRLGPGQLSRLRMGQHMKDSNLGDETRNLKKQDPFLNERGRSDNSRNRSRYNDPMSESDRSDQYHQKNQVEVHHRQASQLNSVSDLKKATAQAGNTIQKDLAEEMGTRQRKTKWEEYSEEALTKKNKTNRKETSEIHPSQLNYETKTGSGNSFEERNMEHSNSSPESSKIHFRQSQGTVIPVSVEADKKQYNTATEKDLNLKRGIEEPELQRGKRVKSTESALSDRSYQVDQQQQMVGSQEVRPNTTDTAKTLIDIFWESEGRPKGFCFTQLERGKCHKRQCNFRHIDEKNLKEYQRIKKLKLSNISRERSENPEVSEDISSASVKLQPPDSKVETKNALHSKCEIIQSLLSNGNLAGAMHVMERIDKMQDTPLLALIERCLYLCSKNSSDYDTSAQVAIKAFSLIGKVRGKNNRHDFTTLIECLCNAGQYIMAYQKLSTMKQSGQTPTLDVFLNLIKSSKDNPKWAFQLLEEIRQLDLLKPRICHELIVLGSSCNPPMITEVMDLYQLMVQSSNTPSQEDYNSIIKMLCDSAQWDHLCTLLCSYSQDIFQIPVQAFEGALTCAGKSVEWIERIVNIFTSLMQQGTVEISFEAWLMLLTAVSSTPYPKVEHSLLVLEWIEKCGFPFNPQPYLLVITAMANRGLLDPAITAYEKLVTSTTEFQDPSLYEFGMQAFCKALQSKGVFGKLLQVLYIMMEHGIKPQEETLKIAVDILAEKKNFLGVYQLFKQCEQINYVLSIPVFQNILSALEKYVENPEASVEVYLSFRKAYPFVPDEEKKTSPEVNSTAARPTRPQTVVCRFVNTPRGCMRGDKCSFLHPGKAQAPQAVSEVCKFYSTPTGCAKGSECLFQHPNNPTPKTVTNLSQPVVQAQEGVESVRTAPTNPFVLKDLQGEHGQLNNPFATTTQPIPSDQQLRQTVRRSRSADWQYTSQEGTNGQLQQDVVTQNWNQPNSAPVLHGGGFQFPDKQNPQFYIPKIQFAGAQRQWNDIAVVYTEMKSAGVTIEQDVIMYICAAFTSNGAKNSSVIFTQFLSKLQDCLQQIQPSAGVATPRSAFDENDKYLVGEIGICLVNQCHSAQDFREGYRVLHKLHEYQVLYLHPNKGFGSVSQLSPPGVAILAADTCLKAAPPQHEGAMIVLEHASFINPEGNALTAEEINQRGHIFQVLITHFLSENSYPRAQLLLQMWGVRDAYETDQRSSLYNDLLSCLVADGLLDFAKDVFEEMKASFVSPNIKVVRALVNGFAATGKTSQAKAMFLSECDLNVYSDNPWAIMIPTSLTKFETQFLIENHLNELHEKIITGCEENWYNDNVCNPLKVILTFETSTDSFSGNLAQRRMADEMRVMIQNILLRFNPPIVCETKSERFEEIVLPRDGLRRWFLANPITGRHRPLTSGNNNGNSNESDLRHLISHPYLQPGMVNTLAEAQADYEVENEGDKGRIVRIVSGGSSSSSSNNQQQQGSSFAVDANQERVRNEKKDFRSRVAHTICGRLTRYLTAKIITREEFKKHARNLTQRFVDTIHMEDIPRLLAEYESTTRLQVVQFVDYSFHPDTGTLV